MKPYLKIKEVKSLSTQKKKCVQNDPQNYFENPGSMCNEKKK
jgi:hypothetical protein